MKKLHQSFLKIMCYVISLLLAFSIIATLEGGLSSVTIGNRNYLTSVFSSDKTVSAIEAQLKKDLKPVADETGIPLSVYVNAVSSHFIKAVQSTALSSIYRAEIADYADSSSVGISYRNAIERYYEKNGEAYTEEQVSYACALAVNAFNNNMRIENTAQLSPFATALRDKSFGFCIAFAVISILLIVCIHFLNGRRHKGLNFVAMSLVTAGEIMIAVSAVIMAKGFDGLFITNISAYNQAVYSVINTMAASSIIAGILFFIIGISIFIMNYRYYSRKILSRQTEYEIYKNLI